MRTYLTTPHSSIRTVWTRALLALVAAVGLVLAGASSQSGQSDTSGQRVAAAVTPIAPAPAAGGVDPPVRTVEVATIAVSARTEFRPIDAKNGKTLSNHRFKSRGTSKPATPTFKIRKSSTHTTPLDTGH